jgi:hypothetical protein
LGQSLVFRLLRINSHKCCLEWFVCTSCMLWKFVICIYFPYKLWHPKSEVQFVSCPFGGRTILLFFLFMQRWWWGWRFTMVLKWVPMGHCKSKSRKIRHCTLELVDDEKLYSWIIVTNLRPTSGQREGLLLNYS